MNRAKDTVKGKESKDTPSKKEMKKEISYKIIIGKPVEQLRAEALKAAPKEMKLREDAYAALLKPNLSNEFLYPYIPYSNMWISPLELKYVHLNPTEARNVYLKDLAEPYLYPKEYNFYYAILEITKSVEFDSISRSGSEWAYSKAFIKQVYTTETWNGDLYRYHEIPRGNRKELDKFWFNYFDYIKSWDGAFCYDNRQRKHSWFLQFRDFNTSNLPQWF